MATSSPSQKPDAGEQGGVKGCSFWAIRKNKNIAKLNFLYFDRNKSPYYASEKLFDCSCHDTSPRVSCQVEFRN
jgi:hypothetical protein